MNAKKTVRKVGPKGKKAKVAAPSPEEKKQNSTTMPIQLDAMFEDVTSDHNIHIQVTIPGTDPFTIPMDAAEILIGRESHCTIYLPIPNVSREHARIIRNGEAFTIEDLNSTNGTFVNNVRIISCVLHHSDQIRIGQAVMTFARVHAGGRG